MTKEFLCKLSVPKNVLLVSLKKQVQMAKISNFKVGGKFASYPKLFIKYEVQMYKARGK